MFAWNLFNENKVSKDIRMADLPVFGVCSANREIMHTGHRLCRLASKKHLACPDMSIMFNLVVHR